MKIKRNYALAASLICLILVSIALGFWDRYDRGTQVDIDLFVIENIDQVDRLIITRGEEVIDGRAFARGFLINNQYPMDENLLTVLAAVLQQVRVQRPMAKTESENIWPRLKENGSHVQIFDGALELASFWAGGDDQKKNSYFATEEGLVYLVHLPGYTSYLSGLFELPLIDWRSKTIFINTWRSLISFNYQDFSISENDFQINYNDPFFSVSGIQQLDSNRVMNYLQDLVALKAVKAIDTTFQGMPWLELATNDIDPLKNQTLTLYGDASESSVIGKVGDQYFEFTNRSLEPIIKNSAYFESEK